MHRSRPLNEGTIGWMIVRGYNGGQGISIAFVIRSVDPTLQLKMRTVTRC